MTAPPTTVLDYLRDFANAEQWDPGTQTCSRIDVGPVAIGSRWHNVSKILGLSTELDYTLKESTGDRLVFEGKNSTATSIDTIVVTPTDGGATVSYRADLRLHGVAAVLGPAMKLVFEKIAGETEDQLTEVLNALPA